MMLQPTALGGLLLLAVSASCMSVPRSHVAVADAWVQPSETTAYMKGRLDLSLLSQPPTGTANVALSECSVRPPKQKTFTKLSEAGAVGRLALLGKLADGACGVRVQPVSEEDGGVWTLRAVFAEGGSATSALATVNVEGFSAVVEPALPSVAEGDSFGLRLVTVRLTPPALSKCSAVLPSGVVVELASASASQAGAKGRVTFDGDGSDGDDEAAALLARGWCAARVSGAGVEDMGRWVLEATEEGTGIVLRGETSVTVNMLRVVVLPSRVAAVQGEKVLLKLVFSDAGPKNRSWTGCQAVRPDGQVVQLAGSGPTGTASGSGLVQDDAVKSAAEETDLARGVCAALVGPLAARHAGVWRLAARDADGGATRSAKAIIDVKAPYQPSAATVTLAPGLLAVRLDCGPANALACTLRDPAGGETAFRGACRLPVDRVRERHRGVWTCAALVEGYARPVNDTLLVQLAEPALVETSVARSGGRAVLACRLASASASASACPSGGAASCRWEPPSGPPLLLREAVQAQGADARYAYAGRGLRSCDCSLAVRAPLHPEDLGVWRCVIGFLGAHPRGGFVTLAEEDAPSLRQPRAEAAQLQLQPLPLPMLAPPSGLVAPGTPLTVGCRVARPLAYCWLRTPSGDLLTLDEAWRSADGGARYAGLAFELGECAVRVEAAAAANHSGSWRCGLGVAGRGSGQPVPDVELAVSVVVSESLLLAVRPNVTVVGVGSGPAALHCRTALAEGLRYCRFQRPDGSSIQLADAGVAGEDGAAPPATAAGRFRYDGLDAGLPGGVCGIAISPVAEEDYGEWTCAVALAGDTAGQEQKASIWLQPPEGDVAEAALIGAGVALLGVAAITVMVIGGRHYQRTYLARSRRRAGSSASWLSEDEDERVLEMRRFRHSPPPSASVGTRRTRSSTTRVSGLATTRLPSRTRRSGGSGSGRARPSLRASAVADDDDLAETRVGDDAVAVSGVGVARGRENTPSSGNDDTPPPLSRKKQ